MYPMDTIELFQRFSIALAIGLLIGLERGWQAREDTEGERAAGVRTLALAALLGAVWAAIALSFGKEGATSLALAFAAFAVAIILFRYRETEHEQSFGATTVVAAMLAFALGAFAVLGDMAAAAAAGVAATGLLAVKALLHSWVARLTWPELRSVLVLLVMSCISAAGSPASHGRSVRRGRSVRDLVIDSYDRGHLLCRLCGGKARRPR